MGKAVQWAIASAMALDSPTSLNSILPALVGGKCLLQMDESSHGVNPGEDTSGAVQVQQD